MDTIWKFDLLWEDVQAVRMPVGAVALTVQMQGETMVLWALVDPDAPTEPRRFAIRGTGHLFPPDRTGGYISTVQDPRGLVWHVFELTVEEASP